MSFWSWRRIGKKNLEAIKIISFELGGFCEVEKFWFWFKISITYNILKSMQTMFAFGESACSAPWRGTMGTGTTGLTLQVLWKHRFSHAGMYLLWLCSWKFYSINSSWHVCGEAWVVLLADWHNNSIIWFQVCEKESTGVLHSVAALY